MEKEINKNTKNKKRWSHSDCDGEDDQYKQMDNQKQR